MFPPNRNAMYMLLNEDKSSPALLFATVFSGHNQPLHMTQASGFSMLQASTASA
jgi:hypothetical protein